MKKMVLLFTILCVGSALNGMEDEDQQQKRRALNEFDEQMRKQNLLSEIKANYQRQLQEITDDMLHQLGQQRSIAEKMRIRNEWQQRTKLLEQEYNDTVNLLR